MQSNNLVSDIQDLALAGLNAKSLKETVEIFKLIESCCRHGHSVITQQERDKYGLDKKDL